MDVVVVVIRGCPWPLLLRTLDDGTFKIIAACYLHGVMYGEAFREHVSRGEQDRFFKIR